MTGRMLTPTAVAARPKPDNMVTLVCQKCRMALYMSERALQMRTWRCPSCGTITNTLRP